MKKFVNPEVQVENLELADVITTSGGECLTDGIDCDTDMGLG